MGKRSVNEIVNALLLTKGSFSSGEIAQSAGVSRQAIHRYLAAMAEAGTLVAQGKGRATRYVVPPNTFRRRLPVKGLAESDVWADITKAIPLLGQESVANARAILGYAFTEMLNNAIDHSGSREVETTFDISNATARFVVADEGVGVYENVRKHYGLSHVQAALQEISKGKTTTQSDRHTGQGIFFTSKVGDTFQLEANGVLWTVDNRREDVAITDVPSRPGTTVRFELSLTTAKPLEETLAQYSHDDFQFDTSRIVVKLFEHGVEFVSRSEAKRILAGLERFRYVIVDFNHVKTVGQGFADEIFRVWAAAHPDVRLETVNMQPPVEILVERSRRTLGGIGGVLVTDIIRGMDFPLGWNEVRIRRVLEDADALTQLTIPSDPESKIMIATRRNVRKGDWNHLGIIVGPGDIATTGIASAFVLPRQETSEDIWTSPTEALKRFVDLYGKNLTVGLSPSKKFFLDESYPLANLDPSAPTFLLPHTPGHPYAATVRARKSDLGLALVTIGYVIDYEKYTQALAHAEIHIDFS